MAHYADDSLGPGDAGLAPRSHVFQNRTAGSSRLRKKKRLKSPSTLRDAVRLVARIGGYLGRKNDPEPGHQLMWEGYSQLLLMCEGFALRDSETTEGCRMTFAPKL